MIYSLKSFAAIQILVRLVHLRWRDGFGLVQSFINAHAYLSYLCVMQNQFVVYLLPINFLPSYVFFLYWS